MVFDFTHFAKVVWARAIDIALGVNNELPLLCVEADEFQGFLGSIRPGFSYMVKRGIPITVLLKKNVRMPIQVQDFRQDDFLETILGRGLYKDLNPDLPSGKSAIRARRGILLVALQAVQQGSGTESFFNFSEALTAQVVKRALQEVTKGPKKRTKLDKELRAKYNHRSIVSVGESDIAQAFAMLPYKKR